MIVKWKSLSCVWLFANPMDYTVHGIFQARIPEWPFPSPGDLPTPGIKPRSPALQAGSLPPEPQGKPKNTGVGSLSLLQGIFPPQGSNPGLLHCRWILYQLNHKECIPNTLLMVSFDPYNGPRIFEWLLDPFYRWGEIICSQRNQNQKTWF